MKDMEKKIEKAAIEYAKETSRLSEYHFEELRDLHETIATDFKTGALSDAAKEYWQAQFQQTQNNVWVKASERLPEVAGDYFCKTNIGKAVYFFDGKKFPYWLMDSTLASIEWLDENPNQ